MKKLSFLIIFLLSTTMIFGQLHPVATSKMQKLQPVLLKENLLDVNPAFKRAAIKFVPITPDYSKGYQDTKVYEWVDPNGAKHSAKGKDILDELNKFEAELNKRGHSLREKKTMDGLTLNLAKAKKNAFANCVINNKITKSATLVATTKGINPNLIKFASFPSATIKAYILGIYIPNGEFRQISLFNEVSLIQRNNDLTSSLTLNGSKVFLNTVATCTVDLSEQINGTPILSTTIDVQKPASTVKPRDNNFPFSIDKSAVDVTSLPEDYALYNYNLVFSNGVSKIPLVAHNSKQYYANIKFYNASGNLIKTQQPNQLVFNNQLPMPINMPSTTTTGYAAFNYDFTDPGLHAFGFYAKSNGISAKYTYQGVGYNGYEMESDMAADMHVGVKYYNWAHLVDGDAPVFKEMDLFGYSLQSKEQRNKPDNPYPPVKTKKDLLSKDPASGILTLLGDSYDLGTTDQTEFKKVISETIADYRFFIGPVPCRITVSATGTVSVTANYAANNYASSHTTITPHADITMEGSGGVDALIAYAKIVADVNLLTIEMPCNIDISSDTKKVTATESLNVGGLSGHVYFEAGICIPIPIFDDICEDFRVDILNWDGFEKDFKVDPEKGIVL